jgi:hypothetical protein
MTGPGVGELIGGDRPMRVCDLCGGYDDHPRHVIVGTGAEQVPAEVIRALASNVDVKTAEGAAALASLMDTKSQDRHMDCCRAAGCPTGDCDMVTLGAEDKRGAALLGHIMQEG